ncbi:MAG: chorismate synthase [Planctomycetes bacterium]|nr:chorismate synthase [Planctomycetota bacterium]
MAYLTFHSAGESHGRGCFAFLEGLPYGVPVDLGFINAQLARRQLGYGRGGRMKIEKDQAEVLSGVRKGVTMGAPVLLAVFNKDFRLETAPELFCPRPGHADLAGHLKFDAPIRDILERASARETAARVAAGALSRLLLAQFGIEIRSHVVALGPVEVPAGFSPAWEQLGQADTSEVRCLDAACEGAMKAAIDEAKKEGNTLGGIFEIVVQGLPVGLGDHTQWDRKLDGRIAQGMMSIQAIKGVEIGLGFRAARLGGREVHDAIQYDAAVAGGRDPAAAFRRPTNGAGGLEGGITNGAPLVVRAAMKPISTLMKPLMSVDLQTGEPYKADIERSDFCALPAASVVGENFLAFVLAQALCEKFGGDSLREMKANHAAYLEHLNRPRGGGKPQGGASDASE